MASQSIPAALVHKIRESDFGKNDTISMRSSSSNVISIAESRECEEVRVAVKNLEHAWARYGEAYQRYVLKNLSVQEFERVEQC